MGMSEAKGSSIERKPAPGSLTMQQGYLMKTASIVGIILIVLGIGSLAYSAAPLQLLIQDVEQQNSNPEIPILGGLALIGGIALLFATRPRGSA
jgi:uncharacterized membrane protein